MAGSRTVNKDDSYATKIAKYVPAESIVLATGFFAAFDLGARWHVLLAVAVFTLVNFVYLFGVAHAGDQQTPDVHYYVLSALAFLLWSAAAIDAVAGAWGLQGTSNEPQRAWVLAVATGFIPLLDTAAGSNHVRARLTALRRPHEVSTSLDHRERRDDPA